MGRDFGWRQGHTVAYRVHSCLAVCVCLLLPLADQVTRKVAGKGSMGFFADVSARSHAL